MLKNIVEITLNTIMGKFQMPTDFKEFQTYLDEHGWPISYSRSEFVKAINLLLEEKLPEDYEGEMLDLLLGQSRSAIKLTEKQRSELQKFLSIAKSAKKQKCDHDNMGIAPFAHGGGFCPVYAQPELICLGCGLNITLYTPKDIKLFIKELGINTTQNKMAKLSKWAKDCLKNSHAEKRAVPWADDITKDPIVAYKKADWKWEGKIPFTITDKKAFESNSGK